MTTISFETSKIIAELLGETAPKPLAPAYYRRKDKTWSRYESADMDDYPKYSVADLLSKPFCEAMSSALWGNDRWHTKVLEQLIDGWYYGDMSELEINILNMITEAKKP